MKINYLITDEILQKYDCLEKIDRTSLGKITQFKQRARLQQAIWRKEHGFKKGVIKYGKKPYQKTRSSGSRIEYQKSKPSTDNYFDEQIVEEINKRLNNPEPHQMINRERLWSNLLSSMPMCFNLFGMLGKDMVTSGRLLRNWIHDVPQELYLLRFEWSPGRSLSNQFLENRSAFDCAFEFKTGENTFGVLGIETKYHEHAVKEKVIKPERLSRYIEIAQKSGVYKTGAIKNILGSNLQQIWQDHLLVLSMLQHSSKKWNWGKFLLVHPKNNLSFAKAGQKYKKLLLNDSTFEIKTIESALDANLLPSKIEKEFRYRYLW
ncbi:MAG: hypothetical protein QQN41_10245 [Nitrosopumilus sp.]